MFIIKEVRPVKTALIIAEFNPYHNGHKYIAEKARELTGADYVAALMSGNFVQRGGPAIVDRFTRARMALNSGIDLVISYPTRYATCSAEEYAGHAMRIAHELGCFDVVFFGSECGDIDKLTECAKFLAEEPFEYQTLLRRYLKQGCSFPQARARALPRYKELLSTPNNILGIEYIKAILRGKYDLLPMTCARVGTDHASMDFSGEYASATAIRERIFKESAAVTRNPSTNSLELSKIYPESSQSGSDQLSQIPSGISEIASSMPAASYKLLVDAHQKHTLLLEDDLSFLLTSALWEAGSARELTKYLSVTDTFANAAWSLKTTCLSFSEFAMMLKNRSLTYTHVSRALLHIALRIEKDADVSDVAHILGMRKEAGPLISRMTETSQIPVIKRPARELAGLSDAQKYLFDEELRISNLYNILVGMKSGQEIQNDMSRRLITL